MASYWLEPELSGWDSSWTGLIRLDLPEDVFIPAPGQGALAVETRTEIPADLATALARIHDECSAQETRIERLVLRGLHGGCTLPLGVRCTKEGEKLHLKAFLGLTRERTPRQEKSAGMAFLPSF